MDPMDEDAGEEVPRTGVASFGEIDASQVKDVGSAIAAGIAAGNVEIADENAETMDIPQVKLCGAHPPALASRGDGEPSEPHAQYSPRHHRWTSS